MTLKLVLGGTFDPCHVGHINSARALMKLFPGSELVLVPSKTPPHRENPAASPEQRYDMLRLATAEVPGLECDNCELLRAGRSYTFDTLAEYRRVMGEDPLVFVMGFDAWVTLPSWYQWRQLCDLSHLLVMTRPGGSALEEPAELKEWAQSRWVDHVDRLASEASGLVCHVTLPQYAVSATEVREAVRRGDSTENILHPDVADYIARHHLYLDNENHGK